MGAPSAQVQSSQSSQPASKGAGVSPSTPGGSGKGSMSAISGQPTMGSPNTNGNTGMAPVNPNFVGQTDGSTSGNPYPNTISNWQSVDGGPNGQPMGQPMAKGAGGGQGGGKNGGAPSAIENMSHPNSGPQGPGSTY